MFVKPREAATIAVIRDSNKNYNTLETLMLKRHSRDRFLPSYYVFPGGAIDSQDVSLANDFCNLPVYRNMELKKSEDFRFFTYLFGAIRETFEESGLLFAYNNEGKYIEIGEEDTIKYNILRNKIYRKELKFSDFINEEKLTLACDKIFYYNRWITPPHSSIRYDTRFFIASAPKNQLFTHDGIELVESIWMKPETALDMHSKGKMKMVMPTISTLKFLSDFNSTDEIIHHFKNLNG